MKRFQPRALVSGLIWMVLAVILPAVPTWAQTSEPAEAPPAPGLNQGEQTPSNPAAEPDAEEPPQLPKQPSALNPETLRMIEMIERKNRELKKREEDLLLREKNIKILEKKVLADLKKIEEALERSEAQVGIKRDLIEKNVNALVKAYTAMKPDQAATLLERMDEDIAIQIISRMKSKVAGKVLARMDTRIAKDISEKIAGKQRDTENRSERKP